METNHLASSPQEPPQHTFIILRHGQTEWSQSGKHTSITDIDLTEEGIEQAKSLTNLIKSLQLTNPYVVSSPRVRARRTAELAGLQPDVIDENLQEWRYGSYEGITSAHIHQSDPGWRIWDGITPEGETPTEIQHRANHVIATYLPLLTKRDVILIGHGHFSRALICSWLNQPLSFGAHLTMEPASLARLGFAHQARSLIALGLRGENHYAASDKK